MMVRVLIVDGPVTDAHERAALGRDPHASLSAAEPGRIGARLRFEGIVRRDEPRSGATTIVTIDTSSHGDSPNTSDIGQLSALDYTAYEPMASRELERVAREVSGEFGVEAMFVLHSRGRVMVGEVSFVLIVESAHRAPALRAMGAFIDRMKRDVPIWKVPVW